MIFLQGGPKFEVTPLACVRQFEREHSTHVYNLGRIYCGESHKTQESRAITGRTVRSAVNVDTYRISQLLDNGTFMYAKHGKLVEADASGTKASTKHIASSLEVIQGHAFWDH